MKRALITGITGQDGSYLAELLLNKGYQVFGVTRSESWFQPNCASHLADRVQPIFGNICEGVDITNALLEARPHEIYNLASQSRPSLSWSNPQETIEVNAIAFTRLVEAVRRNSPDAKIYHASSSEMFGHQPGEQTQDETTPFNPVNPYAASKVFAHQLATIYRASHQLFIACGILFNHESERRPLQFVTQKVAYGAACASLGITNSHHVNERGRPIVENGKLALGDLNIARDWGYAPDFVEAMWLMLQQNEPEDFVIGTGEHHSLIDLCKKAYLSVDCDWEAHVFSDPALTRPSEPSHVRANPRKAKEKLGWSPKASFEQMIKKMVETQINRLTKT